MIDGASPISTTSLISSNNPSIFGNSVSFTAAVSGVSPTGTVAFKEGFSGEVTGCAAQALVAGTATCTTSTLSINSHGITAVYSGDSNNVASSSAWLFQYVLTPTTTSLASSSNPSNFGSSVTFTATVTGSSYGTVTFRDGGVDIANCVALPRISGDVTCTTNALTAGTHTIGAFFSGTGFSAPSSNELYQLVKPPTPTTTSIISSSNPSKNRSNVTFTATVTAGSPTGTVAFQDGGATIVGCAAQALVAGTAACSTSTLALGNHSITAAYSGDASHTASTSPVLIQSVLKSLPKK